MWIETHGVEPVYFRNCFILFPHGGTLDLGDKFLVHLTRNTFDCTIQLLKSYCHSNPRQIDRLNHPKAYKDGCKECKEINNFHCGNAQKLNQTQKLRLGFQKLLRSVSQKGTLDLDDNFCLSHMQCNTIPYCHMKRQEGNQWSCSKYLDKARAMLAVNFKSLLLHLRPLHNSRFQRQEIHTFI